ncbi:MAG TPA: hypothetical protein DEQ02_07900, partial [Ruminococcaceae bacterium]|nr:hypothetical protein [Oscillospiraceae bacterium]
MKRLISLFITLLLVIGFVSVPANTVSAAEVEIQYTGERKLSFNEDWKFRLLSGTNFNDTSLDNASTGARAIEYNDDSWQNVELPHDWSIYQAYTTSGGVRVNQGALPGGTGWYRKSFTLPDDFKGKTVKIRFDGVMQVSEVYVNGVANSSEWKQYLGYVTFEYDITEYLRFDGQTNTIAVKCQSSNSGARWYQGGGIYRNVWLLATDPVYVPMNGVFVTTPKSGLEPAYDLYQPMTNPESAQVDIATELANDNDQPATISLKSTVYDKAGDVVSATQAGVELPANGVYEVSQSVDVPNPKLWSTDSPNLYWVRTEVMSGQTVIDTVTTRFGIRYLDLNTNQGLFLNGVYTQLYGTCEHSDLGPLGMEVYQAAVDRRILKLKAMGANAIRTAHNPVSPEFIEACDRLGMLVMEEAFDQWTISKNGGDYSNYFAKSTTDGSTNVFTVASGTASLNWVNPNLTPNAVRDIQAMVDRDKNAPSVFTWSTGNEIYDTKQSYGVSVLNLLMDSIREIDPTRPISSCPPTWDGWSNNGPMERNMAAADIGGFNYAHGQYAGAKSRNPNMNIVGSETVSAFYTRGMYYPNDYGTRVRNRGDNMSSEYPFEYNFVTATASIVAHRDTPFAFGEFVWTGHDYLGEPTPHGGNAMSSVFGIIDSVGLEKDAFYLYRSNWTDIPTCHLLPQDWTSWTQGDQIPVMVYTNGRSVELYLNGTLIGTRQFNKATASPVYVEFGRVTYAPGELKAVAKDANGNVIAEDIVYSSGTAQSVELSADRAFIKNDGRDLVYVEATVQDSAGIMVPRANNRITVNAQGGEVIAVGNGNPLDRESQRGRNDRRAFSGKAVFIIAADEGYTGDITITATADGLTANTVTVGSVAEIDGDGTGIIDFERPEITVGVGIAPKMPETIRVILDNGVINAMPVSVWNLDEMDVDTPGTYTVSGLAGTGTVEAIVHVKEIDAVSDIYITTIAGVEPPLPQFVTINYKDGEVGAAPVSWDAVEPSQYAGINRFTVQGRLGPTFTINAFVTVKEIISVTDTTVYTTVGTVPDMPANALVRFNDGTEERLAVEWEVPQSAYAYPGEAEVYGRLLGSEIQAKANLIIQYMVYLSDLDWQSKSGEVVKDTTVGGNQLSARNYQGGPPFPYAKGIGTLADSEVVYDIAGKGYDDFSALVSLGFDFGQGAPGTVIFKVYVDGELKYESPEMTHAKEYQTINLPVTGAFELKIVAEGSEEFEPQYNLADWCDAKFLSDNIVVESVSLQKTLYRNNLNQIPRGLPSTVQANVNGVPGSFQVEWPPLNAGMFASAGVQTVYGKVIGTANGIAAAKIITDYDTASAAADFYEKIGEWNDFENFNFGTALDAVVAIPTNVTPSLLHNWTNNMRVENVQKYGFERGLYPNATTGTNYVTFAAPGLKSFVLRNVSNTAAIANGSSFTISTSSDGTAFTAFTGWAKSNAPSGEWPQRYYTSNAPLPENTNFLRITWPTGNTWQFNLTNVTLTGGAASAAPVSDLAYFELAGYVGTIDHEARTVTLCVPTSLDLTNLEPEIRVTDGAVVDKTGPQDFTNPVVYTVSNGGSEKAYTVNVERGHTVTFDLEFGNIAGDTSSVSSLIPDGARAVAPLSPVKAGYNFEGWSALYRGSEAVNIAQTEITSDITFYAIWSKKTEYSLTAVADAQMQTWQTEKATNYGGDSFMRVRSGGNDYGHFGERYNGNPDNADMKVGLIKFDISELVGKTVESASINMRWHGRTREGGSTGNTNIRMMRTAANWEEKTVNWNRKPAYFTADTLTSNTFAIGGTQRTNSSPFNANTGTNATAVTFENSEILRGFVTAAANEGDFLSVAVNESTASTDYGIISREGASQLNRPAYTPTLNVTVTPEPDYYVTYDLSGGTGEIPREDVKEEGMSFAAAGAAGIEGPDGKLFESWNTKADGTGDSYYPGDAVTVGAENLTLYAVWSEARGMILSYEAYFERVGIVTVRASDPADTEILIAAYDDNGRMTDHSYYALDPNAGQEQQIIAGFDYAGAASVRIFLWDKSSVPLCEPEYVNSNITA